MDFVVIPITNSYVFNYFASIPLDLAFVVVPFLAALAFFRI